MASNFREQWILINKTNKTYTIGDLPRLPQITPKGAIDVLCYYNKSEVEQSEALRGLINGGKITVRKNRDGSTEGAFSGDSALEAIALAEENETVSPDDVYTKAEVDALLSNLTGGTGGGFANVFHPESMNEGYIGPLNIDASFPTGSLSDNYDIQVTDRLQQVVEAPDGYLYGCIRNDGEIIKIDPVALEIVDTLDVIAGGNEVNFLEYCPLNNRLWVGIDFDDPGTNGDLRVIDLEDFTIAGTFDSASLNPGEGRQIVYNPYNGYLYWSIDAGGNGQVRVIDPLGTDNGIGSLITTIAVDTYVDPYSCHPCALDKRMYVAGFSRNGNEGIVRLDAAGTAIDGGTPFLSMAASASIHTQDLVFNPIDNKMYCTTANDGDGVVTFNMETLTYAEQLTDSNGGVTISRNPRTGNLYVGADFGIYVINGHTQSVSAFSAGGYRYNVYSNTLGHMFVGDRDTGKGLIRFS